MENRGERLKELAVLFLRLGSTAFGGPAAHIAMMQDEVVERKRWVDRETFLDMMGATNLIPGPNSTELAIHIGYERAGWAGLAVAGACFIIPAMVIVMTLAYVYDRFGSLPSVGWLMAGIKPVIVAIVAQALWALTKTAVKGWQTGLVAAGVVAGSLLGVHEILLLAFAGGLMMLARQRGTGAISGVVPIWLAFSGTSRIWDAPTSQPTLTAILLFFLKIGSVLYGSGYVLLAFLQSDLVDRLGWISSQQLLDAVAVGQFTPGPVFTTATFIGYLIGGWSGSVLATVGIFLPAFLLVGLIQPVLPRLRKSVAMRGFLDGVNAASLALMAIVAVRLGLAAVTGWLPAVTSAVSLFLLIRYKVNATWLVIGGAAVGWADHLTRAM